MRWNLTVANLKKNERSLNAVTMPAIGDDKGREKYHEIPKTGKVILLGGSPMTGKTTIENKIF